MSESENLFGEEHIQRYRETNGEVGHDWKRGTEILLLTTKGRKSGEPRTSPLIYVKDDNGNHVVIASKGGTPENPGWYLNLEQNPEVELQVKDDVFPARARTATGEEREQLWKRANEAWPDYDEYQTKTDRQIPVVVLERA
jgi:proline iminopeptidase